MKHPSFDLELVDVNLLTPSSYNPRESEREKLDLISLSLRKFGFLIPVYASRNGEILSGHQRHLVSKELGLEKVPVIFLPEFDELTKKNINILFNRGTNDFLQKESTTSASEKINTKEITHELGQLRDLTHSEIISKIFSFTYLDLKDLSQKNSAVKNIYPRTLAIPLFKKRVYMPIIISEKGYIINGIGRLETAINYGFDEYPCIMVSKDHIKPLNLLLNFLTMNFTLQKQYADILRFNSHRRILSVDEDNKLGMAFLIGIQPTKRNYHFDIMQEKNQDLYRRIYGETILDFGAGTLFDTKILNKHGFKCVAFEPYYTNGKVDVDKEASIKVVKNFLKELKAGIKFDSIILSAILNSVPFQKDREHVLTIINALSFCSQAVIYSTAQSITAPTVSEINRESYYVSKNLSFFVNYEPNIAISEIATKPKVQKYFTEKEMYNLFKKQFKLVSIHTRMGYVQCIAKNALKPNKAKLNEALKFEFDLPYPDGTRMNLVDQAKSIFQEYLK